MIAWSQEIGDAIAKARNDTHLSRQANVLIVDLDDPTLRALIALQPTLNDAACAAAYGGVARHYFFARRAVLRHVIAGCLGAPAETVIVAPDMQGAPCLMAPKLPAELFLSISGSGAIAAFAIAPRPVGVDIEILGSPKDVPRAMLNANEIVAIHCLDDAARHETFLKIWTVKEAYVKACRTGLRREPSEIEVRLDEGHRIALFDRGQRLATAASGSHVFKCGQESVIAACIML